MLLVVVESILWEEQELLLVSFEFENNVVQIFFSCQDVGTKDRKVG